jgi:glycerol-3-phosphate dehydrogenase
MTPPASSPVSEIDGRPWDVLVIGGGIIGAGIYREAARRGLHTLLVEQNDFASGASSRSSKLVHGGLHYMMRLQLGLAFRSVRERDRLLREEAGLVAPLEMVIPRFADEKLPDWFVAIGLDAYDALGGRLRHHPLLRADQTAAGIPCLSSSVTGAFAYWDACADDARLVQKVLHEGARLGGTALNYTSAERLLRSNRGRVHGAALLHKPTGRSFEVPAGIVINAAGPWVDRLRTSVGGAPRVRLIRGSHLVVSRCRLPLTRGIVTQHPDTREPFYLLPWEGSTLIGSTSVEHGPSLEDEPRISPQEAGYLLRGARWLFPELDLRHDDVLATFAGLRPVVDTATRNPARASREAVVWEDAGMLTAGGGKLTIFEHVARQVVDRAVRMQPALRTRCTRPPDAGDPLPGFLPFDRPAAERLWGKYGWQGLREIAAMPAPDREPVPGHPLLWGELRWAARHEQIEHLDDLLLRRTRLGLTDPGWATDQALHDPIRAIARTELGWSHDRWNAELRRYTERWNASCSLPNLP